MKILLNAFLAILLFSRTLGYSQTFPLKISSEGNCIITKKETPFLINGRVADINKNFDAEIANLPRYGYQKINAVCIFMHPEHMLINSREKPDKNLKKDIKILKRFIREAAFYNVAVMISPKTTSTERLTDSINRIYLEKLFRGLRKNKNVMWILSLGTKVTDLHLNNKQLRGLWVSKLDSPDSIPDNFSFVVSDSIIYSSKPTLLYVKANASIDSSSTFVRQRSYSGILNGAGGIISDMGNTQAPTLYNPITFHLNQLKTVFDTLAWNSLKINRQLIVPENQVSMQAMASKTNDSSLAVIYLPSTFTLPLNLSELGPRLKFWWINPVTGKAFKTIIVPEPSRQLFLPPIDEGKNTDWLLIINSL